MIFYAQHQFNQKEIKACERVLEKFPLTQGPFVRSFENSFQKFCGSADAIAVSSGTAALHLACLASGFKRGDEVIVPAVTFIATANAILYCGAKPVFADIDPETGNITAESIKSRITKRTKGVIVVHYGGQPVDLAKISLLARKKGLIVIEDAAHAIGATYRNRPIGSCEFSDLCTFSFHPAKNITTGEGGMVTTRNTLLGEKIRMLRCHGMTRDSRKLKFKAQNHFAYYEMQDLGFNYRLTDFQSAIGIEQLKKLPKFLKKRSRIAKLYSHLLKNVRGVKPLAQRIGSNAWHLFVIRVSQDSGVNRNSVAQQLIEHQIIPSVHYLPIYRHPYYKERNLFRAAHNPNAEKFYSEILSLPMHVSLSEKDVARVVNIIDTTLRSGERRKGGSK